jgi:ADP-heptose:LPS heptosyltransferase
MVYRSFPPKAFELAARQSLIISRTDSIGDVMLTLPLCGLLKKYYPDLKILFLGANYTRAVVQCCDHVSQFIDQNELLSLDRKALTRFLAEKEVFGIVHVFPNKAIARRFAQCSLPLRLGTTNRIYHWTTCNRLVTLSRKNSRLHEAQLNIALMRDYLPAQVFDLPLNTLADYYGFHAPLLASDFRKLIPDDCPAWVLHPKSKGSAREYPLPAWIVLAERLSETATVFISGTENERQALQPIFDRLGNRVVDIVGKMNLSEFIAFLSNVTGIIAGSTGPLHIGSALGIRAVGLYPPIRPVHPGRWSPVGKHALALTGKDYCHRCLPRNGTCACMEAITVGQITDGLTSLGE